MTQLEYEADPNVDEELVEEVREYAIHEDGRYVEGEITGVKEMRNGRVKLIVSLPNTDFGETFEKPSPANRELQAVANKYGSGLLDLGALKGEKVWCERENGQWRISMRRGRAMRLAERLASLESDTVVQKVGSILMAPVHALAILEKEGRSKRSRLTRAPSDREKNWSQGVVDGLLFIVSWLIIFGVLVAVLS